MRSLATKLVVVYGTTSLKKINIVTYFENLTVGLHVLYNFNIHVKFYVNRMLFTI